MSAKPEGDGALLRVEDVHTYYGSIEALKGISLEVHEGEIVTLIGANGAGKSTTLRSINGLNHPRQGSIHFRGRDITRDPPHDIVRRGISQSPEGRKLFPRMSVLENLEMGAFQRQRPDPSCAATSSASTRSFRGSPNASSSAPAPSRAASSRWWRSGAR